MENLPTDLVISNIIPFIGTSCKAITENGKYCQETWSFKTASGREENCKHYCLKHILEWIKSVFEMEYKIVNNGENEISQIDKIVIKLTDNTLFEIFEDNTFITPNYDDDIQWICRTVDTFKINDLPPITNEIVYVDYRMETEIYNPIKIINKTFNRISNGWKILYTYREDHSHILSKILYNVN